MRARSLGLLEVASAVACVASALFPLSPQAPVRLDLWCAMILAVAGTVTLVRGPRVGDRWLLAQVVGAVVITVALVASAASGGGTILSGAGFIWIALWVSLFFSPRRRAATLGLELAAIPVAVVASAHPWRVLAAAGSVVAVAAASSGVLAGIVGSLSRFAASDQLTGLLNRHGLDLAVARMEGRRHADRPVSLVAIDVDGLKSINDRNGHSAGDRLLAGFAAELSAAARGTDIAARMGGDEFVVVLPGAAAEDARDWAERLKASSRYGWSFGAAERGAGEPFPDWIDRADADLYQAKRDSATRRRSA